MWKNYMTIIILLLAASLVYGSERGTAAQQETFKVLWSGLPVSTGDTFSGAGATIRSMGGKITHRGDSYAIPIDDLAQYDLVVLCCRFTMMSAAEQSALVQYVRNGGGLLVIDGFKGNEAVVQPVVGNFGIIVTGTRSGSKSYDYFVHPATTERRPLGYCATEFPYRVLIGEGAMALAGRNMGGPPVDVYYFAALGGHSGTGRAIVVNDDSVWQTYG